MSTWLGQAMLGKLVKYHFWVSVRVFSEVISELSRDSLSPMQVGSIQSLEGIDRTKWQKAGICFLCLSWDIHPLLLLCSLAPMYLQFELRLGLTPLTLWFLDLYIQTEIHHQLSWFSSLQCRSWGFSGFITTWVDF